MIINLEEQKYLKRKQRMSDFYNSNKLKGVRRMLGDDEYFEALFYKNNNRRK